MRLLFLNAYFEPEQTAFTHLEKDLLDAFVSSGFKIDVITPVPTRGIDNRTQLEYRKKKYEELYDGAVKVHRFWAPQEGKNPIIRAFRYFWCNLREYQIGKKYVDTDVIFSTSTPPTQGWIAGKVKKQLQKKGKRTIRFVYNLQDIFPDSLVNAGMTKEGSIIWNIGKKIESYTYKNADKIIVIGETFKNAIIQKGVNNQKIAIITNWIDIDMVKYIEKNSNRIYDEFNIPQNKFIVLYAGNMGEMQDVDVLVETAREMKNNTDLYFVLFGAGSQYITIEEKIRRERINNVFIHPLLKQNRVSEVYSLGDVAVITCKPGTGLAAIPSKLWTIMACNTPIIASFDLGSELVVHIKNSKAGICVEPGKVEQLKQAIQKMYETRNIRKTIDTRKYVMNNASKENCVKKYIDLIVRQ